MIQKKIIINKRAPYTPFFAEDYLTYSMRIPVDRMGYIFTQACFYIKFGDSEFVPQSEIEQNYYDKLISDYDKNNIRYNKSIENGRKGGRPINNLRDNPQDTLQANPQGNPDHNQLNESKLIESKVRKNNNIYLSLAEKLKKIVTAKKEVLIDGRKLSEWCVHFSHLETIDGVPCGRQQAVLDWYEKKAYTSPYIPVVESGKSFREKFSNLENAIEREKSSVKKITEGIL